MAFQTPLTIFEVVNKIHRHEYLLPSIQREFVWKSQQIVNLFDSLLKEYPINSFLFWKVQRDNTKEYVFYEFIRTYNEYNNRLTKKADVSGEREITAILDGQQRLTSLYIALKGSYAERKKYKKANDISSYPVKKLYLNLMQEIDEDHPNYDFSFLDEKDLFSISIDNRVKSKIQFWFPVSKILDLYEQSDVNDYFNQNIAAIGNDETRKFASKTLFRLHKVIFTSPLVSYFLEEGPELEKVLNIFIRVNSGGTPLSPANLLFSFANAHWLNMDFKESVNLLVSEINGIGSRFDIDYSFILKAILYLSDISDISAKVDNFNSTNMSRFNILWTIITNALKKTFHLVSSLGFCSSNIRANNIYHPIAYFIMKNPKLNIETGFDCLTIRNEIRKWIVLASTKRFFSFSPDGALKAIRDLYELNEVNSFPITLIIERFRGTNRSLNFTSDDIDKMLLQRKDDPTAFQVLSILYPNINFRDTYHIDHIFPKGKMKPAELNLRGISPKLHYEYISKADQIPNLQLLEGSINLQKSDMDFSKYLISVGDVSSYFDKHYIPELPNYDYDQFLVFFENRKKQLKAKLLSLLS